MKILNTYFTFKEVKRKFIIAIAILWLMIQLFFCIKYIDYGDTNKHWLKDYPTIEKTYTF
jgi:hypothetical protein